jgi:hypothetical protein
MNKKMLLVPLIFLTVLALSTWSIVADEKHRKAPEGYILIDEDG